MGKSFSHTAINTVGVVLTIVILLGSREVYPAYREAELFDLAYEQYLASQPEKAVEAFSLFLRQFPQSSAKDAAMFWMGKSFILMKQIQEARNIFDEMAREFPGSPLKPYAIREMEELEKGEMAEERESFQGAPYEGEESQMQARQPREEKVTEKSVESAAQPTGSTVYMVQVAALKSENAAVNLRETLKHHGFKAIIQETSSGEGTRFRVLVGEFRTRRGADLHAIKIKKRTGLDAFSIEVRQAEKGNSAPVSHNGPLGANAENEISEQSLILHKKDSAKSKTRESVMRGKDEQVEVLIEGTQYTAEQVSTYMNNSFAAIHTLGIKEIVWRTGHIYEDFINEQLLYEEARRAGFTGGEREHEKTGEHYGLSPEEAVYLQRYLAICRVVGKKLKEHSGERVVESLSVRYTDGDRREKELLASELQGHAR
ncbi:MAG TPA: SPOR domain-containing protein, partial [Thermodesulfovibrionales bacterium]|nr:SPOR domain-containing protein [Thermodesulfovibrionales bacterium]